MINKPNLFIAGAAKAGTSALFNGLSQHPKIKGSALKEPHFFTENIWRPSVGGHNTEDLNSYLKFFDFNSNCTYHCEASTSYLWDPKVPNRIYDYNPDAKVIIILRNPIERAFSHYEMDLYSEREKDPSFMSALLSDEKRKERVWGKARLYVDLGYYADPVEKYKNLFKQNLLVLCYEDFVSNASSIYGIIWGFLKLENYSVINYTVNKSSSYKNIGRRLKSSGLGKILPEFIKPHAKKIIKSRKGKIPEDAYRYLLKKYYIDIQKLSELGYPFYQELLNN